MQPADWQSGETVKENKDNKYTTGDTYGTLKADADAYKSGAVTGDDSYSYTAQLKATAKVSKNVKANFGFKYEGKFKEPDGTPDVAADKTYAHVNVANVQAKVADQVSVLAGRHDSVSYTHLTLPTTPYV